MAIYVLNNTSAGAPGLSGTAGSLITLLDFLLVTTMGWTKPYTGTNTAAYKQPAGSNGMYLYIDDSGAQSARASAFEAMTAIGVGTNQFPSASQLATAGWVYKSAASSAVTRPWNFFSNGKTFYLCINGAGTTGPTAFSTAVPYGQLGFGDFKTYKSGDAFNTFIAVETAATAVAVSAATNALTGISLVGGAQLGAFIARAHTQLGTSLAAGKASGYGATNALLGGLPYPSPLDGGITLSKAYLTDPGQGVRGVMPGLWCWLHASGTGINAGDTFSGAGDLAGKTFMILPFYGNGSLAGWQVFETSDTWET